MKGNNTNLDIALHSASCKYHKDRRSSRKAENTEQAVCDWDKETCSLSGGSGPGLKYGKKCFLSDALNTQVHELTQVKHILHTQ